MHKVKQQSTQNSEGYYFETDEMGNNRYISVGILPLPVSENLSEQHQNYSCSHINNPGYLENFPKYRFISVEEM